MCSPIEHIEREIRAREAKPETADDEESTSEGCEA